MASIEPEGEFRQSRLWCGALELAEAATQRILSSQELAWASDLMPMRRLEFLRTRTLVRVRLGEWLQCEPRALPLQAPPGKYPLLGDGLGQVSWSHSRGQLLLGWSPQPLGVDLELQSRPLRGASLLKRLCAESEWDQLEALPPEQLRRELLGRWVLLEALTKRRRSRLAQELGQWRWDGSAEHWQHLFTGERFDAQLRVLERGGDCWWFAWSGGPVPAVEPIHGG